VKRHEELDVLMLGVDTPKGVLLCRSLDGTEFNVQCFAFENDGCIPRKGAVLTIIYSYLDGKVPMNCM